KANAYGHGVIGVMNHLYDQGVRCASVSTLEEALELRTFFSDIDILMMGAALKDDLEICSKFNIEMTVYNEAIYQAVLAFDKPLTCHLKVDTGMSRYGFVESNQVIEVVDSLQSMKHIDLKGIYTHFATANDDQDYFEKQLKQFKVILSKLNKKPKMIHVSNSSSALKYEPLFDFTTHIRLGISLYGLSLDEPKPNLKQVMVLKTRIVQTRYLQPGQCVGYSATYCATHVEKIAILPIGYADGFLRRNKNGFVEIRGKRYALVGNICMDACFVSIDEDIEENDLVTLFGDVVTIDEIAKRNQTINYEIVTSISSRVPRIFIKGDCL
ncbi:MAG: alanine racemase, partial [Acholeplasmataceae bacterium]|nr:alanine racemase [Acholeplasmataceae bacterium]